jgi:hypothetical protein
VAKSQFSREHARAFARSALVALALTSCGALTGARSSATVHALQVAPFCAAPVEGSPEEFASARGHCSRSSFGVAPIEGTPEQTAVDLGR